MKHPEQIIRRPLLTEKGTRLKELNQVLLEVAVDANKIEIRGAVQALFSVKVEKVRTQRVPSKEKRLGRFIGRRPAWKKAIVTLAPGSDIDFFATE